jgi:hypothetical protein
MVYTVSILIKKDIQADHEAVAEKEMLNILETMIEEAGYDLEDFELEVMEIE